MQSVPERVKRWYLSLPVLTRDVFTVCVAVYVAMVLFGWGGLLFGTCLSPYRVAMHLELWRVAFSPFVHVGILHLVFNMMAFVPHARVIETHFGTVRANPEPRFPLV